MSAKKIREVIQYAVNMRYPGATEALAEFQVIERACEFFMAEPVPNAIPRDVAREYWRIIQSVGAHAQERNAE